MVFQWDENKSRSNARKHGMDFDEASSIFGQPLLTCYDSGSPPDEDRYVAIGFLGTKLVTVVFAQRPNDVIRIISARKATRVEEKRYERGY